jgi:hypothetical protein
MAIEETHHGAVSYLNGSPVALVITVPWFSTIPRVPPQYGEASKPSFQILSVTLFPPFIESLL